jgi:hypothetical protein
MKSKLPKVNVSEFRIENRAKKLVPLCFNDDWIAKEETGRDFGRDLMMEYTKDGYATNERISIQIKGRSKVNRISNDKLITFPLQVKTIAYALNDSYPFFLFLYDGENNTIYFIELQSYFFNNQEWKRNKDTYNIHIPIDNIAKENKDYLNYCLKRGDK